MLRTTSCWIFFAALAYAPWAYGGTTSESIQIINWLLGAALLLWVIELIVNRRKPKFPALLLVVIGALVAIGGWMSLNAVSIYDSAFGVFLPLRNFAPHLTGSIDYALSVAWMIRGALLLGTILFVVDLSQDNRWLLRLWYAIGVIAGSLTLLGLLQKATGAPMIFWQAGPPGGVKTFFATYYYHANAGAFLNLVLPLTAGLAVRAFTAPSNPGLRAIWMSIFVLNLASVFANTSRMAQLIGLAVLVALSVYLGPKLLRRLSRAEKNVALGGALAILLVLFALGQASHLEQPLNRWQRLGETIPADWRWLASQVAISALPDVGFFGFGPGTFRSIFPYYDSLSNYLAPGSWRFLHEDYLQTALEWGWLGSALWAAVFFGGIGTAALSLRRQRALRRGAARKTEKLKTETLKLEDTLQISASQPFSVSAFKEWSWTPRRRLLLPLVVIALAGVALHAIVDFPLQIASIQLYVATYLGICWGSAGWKGQPPTPRLRRAKEDRSQPPAQSGLRPGGRSDNQ